MAVAAPLRIGVVGVGHLGRHHARILSSLPGARLVAVVDKIGGRAAEIATANRTEASTDYRDLLGEVDAVTIARRHGSPLRPAFSVKARSAGAASPADARNCRTRCARRQSPSRDSASRMTTSSRALPGGRADAPRFAPIMGSSTRLRP